MKDFERPSTAGTERRLDRWGSYHQRVGVGGLGYPSQAPFMRQGPSGDGDATYENARLSEDVAEVDRAVRGCPRHIRAALWQQYAGSGTADQKARALGLSRREFYQRVRHGIDQVHHALHPETASAESLA